MNQACQAQFRIAPEHRARECNPVQLAATPSLGLVKRICRDGLTSKSEYRSDDMSMPSFAAETSLYATSEHYRATAFGATGRLASVFAQQLCRHFGAVLRRNRSLLLSGLEMHRATRRDRHLRAGLLPLLSLLPRPANLLPTAGFWRTLLYPELYHTSVILVTKTLPQAPNAPQREVNDELPLIVTLAKDRTHDFAEIQCRNKPLCFNFGVLRGCGRAGKSDSIVTGGGRGQLCLYVAELRMVLSDDSARLHYDRLLAGTGLLRLRRSSKVHHRAYLQ
jgi:hypothetical protein